MKKILFNKLLIPSVFDGTKTMTRRIVPNKVRVNISTLEEYHLYDRLNDDYHKSVAIGVYSRYKVGEIVAVAQSYKDISEGKTWINGEHMGISVKHATSLPGWNNPMFVKAELMPHQIQITDIRVERLQDISNEDCLLEGIYEDYEEHGGMYTTPFYDYKGNDGDGFCTPREAFASLIDKVSGKGTWERNPCVFAYTFELVK